MPRFVALLRLLALSAVPLLPGCAAPIIVGTALQAGMITSVSTRHYPAAFYPVAGPMAAQPAPGPCMGYLNGLFSGDVVVTLQDAEVFKGTWHPVAQNEMPSGDASLEQDWDFVYGQGFYRAHVLGIRLHLRAALTGSGGATGIVELYRPSEGAEPTGVARDSLGNIYKVTVQASAARRADAGGVPPCPARLG